MVMTKTVKYAMKYEGQLLCSWYGNFFLLKLHQTSMTIFFSPAAAISSIVSAKKGITNKIITMRQRQVNSAETKKIATFWA